MANDLISRKALIADLRTAKGLGKIIAETLVRFLKKQPTVDAVEVVRCKDCRSIIDREDGTHGCYRHFIEECKPDDYCSHGERKDND